MRVLSWHGEMANLSAEDHRSSSRLEQSDESTTCLELALVVEEMDEGTGIDDIDLLNKLGRTLSVHNVHYREPRPQPLPVLKEVEAHFDEPIKDIDAVNLSGRDTVKDEFSYRLAHTASGVEEDFICRKRFESSEHIRVDWRG